MARGSAGLSRQSELRLLGVSSYLQVVLKGAILVVAIWLDNRKEQ